MKYFINDAIKKSSNFHASTGYDLTPVFLWNLDEWIPTPHVVALWVFQDAMGLLPDTQNSGCACAGNAGNVLPVTAGKRSRHASRHVRDARAVMHVGIAN